VPRAGLLGSLAAIALALIAFLPLLLDGIAAVPVVGMLSLTLILVTLVAHRSLPGRSRERWLLSRLASWFTSAVKRWGKCSAGRLCRRRKHPGWWKRGSPPALIPDLTRGFDWWKEVWLAALGKLPIALPFAWPRLSRYRLYESAAAAGDEYDTRTILLTEGVASVAAGLLGGVIQTTPYIGHPAYKTMGGRARTRWPLPVCRARRGISAGSASCSTGCRRPPCSPSWCLSAWRSPPSRSRRRR